MKIVALVPAKGTSERIPNKNVQLLDGRPLVVYTLQKLLACPSIDEIYLDTESEEVWELARDLPVKWLKRDPALADNATDGHALFMHGVDEVEAALRLR